MRILRTAICVLAMTVGTGAWHTAGAAPSPLGPRPLPPTFVGLELGAFPRPASEACAGHHRVVRASPPDGLWRAAAAARPGSAILLAPGTYRGAAGDSS